MTIQDPKFKDAAEACLSLAYKYTTLQDCVQGQRPELLSDPVLAALAEQQQLLTDLFEARVRKLAEGDQ